MMYTKPTKKINKIIAENFHVRISRNWSQTLQTAYHKLWFAEEKIWGRREYTLSTATDAAFRGAGCKNID